MREPKGKQEWQEVVDWAEAALSLDSARLYGLITGGPTVNTERCLDILKRGRDKGFYPLKEHVERCILMLATGKQL